MSSSDAMCKGTWLVVPSGTKYQSAPQSGNALRVSGVSYRSESCQNDANQLCISMPTLIELTPWLTSTLVHNP